MGSTGLATGSSGLATGGVAPVWAELDGNHQIQARYLSKDALDAVFARWAASSAGGVTWNLPDRLGSVRAVMNNSGQLVNRLSYDAFGVSSATAAGVADRFRYAGYPYDAATGLYYVGARWYDPSQGRWLSRDPLGSEAGDVNLYRYVFNVPNNLTDPLGTIVYGGRATFMFVFVAGGEFSLYWLHDDQGRRALLLVPSARAGFQGDLSWGGVVAEGNLPDFLRGTSWDISIGLPRPPIGIGGGRNTQSGWQGTAGFGIGAGIRGGYGPSPIIIWKNF